MTNTPDTIVYSSVVMRETVHIALTMAALHVLEVKAAEALNACVTAPNHKKIGTVLCPEFGDDAGKSAVIVREQYRLNSAGTSFRAHVANACGN